MFATFQLSDLFSGTLNPLRVVLTLLIAFGVGGFLYLIYKKSFAGVVYSRYARGEEKQQLFHTPGLVCDPHTMEDWCDLRFE